jgi:aminoglycoside phosphotransferase family enzyme/predicted kinase
VTDALRETHTSTLLFLDDRVYKRKKPLDLGFSDFRDVDERRRACEAEVRLNRRLSPDVYEGVAEVVGPDGAVCEALVVMRRLPEELSLSHLLLAGSDVRPALRATAEQLVSLHRRSALPPDRRHLLGADRLRQLWESGTAVLAAHPDIVPTSLTAALDALGRDWLAEHAVLFDQRAADGHGVDGHGDLLADDVFVLPDGPRVLDCLEFDDDLRAVDGLHDACALVADLHCLGAHELAEQFLADYRSLSGDAAPPALAELYVAYRALVRAKVLCLRAAQGDPAAAAQALLRAVLCRHHLEAAMARLVVVGGLPGTGKTSVASGLAAREGWVRVSSDDERQVLGRTGYSPADRDAVYDAMLARAGRLLAEGHDVVLDATFASRRWRAAAAAVAAEHHAALSQLRCTAPRRTAHQRIDARRGSSSEATPAVHDLLAEEWEEWPEAVEVDGSQPPDEVLSHARAAVG